MDDEPRTVVLARPYWFGIMPICSADCPANEDGDPIMNDVICKLTGKMLKGNGCEPALREMFRKHKAEMRTNGR